MVKVSFCIWMLAATGLSVWLRRAYTFLGSGAQVQSGSGNFLQDEQKNVTDVSNVYMLSCYSWFPVTGFNHFCCSFPERIEWESKYHKLKWQNHNSKAGFTLDSCLTVPLLHICIFGFGAMRALSSGQIDQHQIATPRVVQLIKLKKKKSRALHAYATGLIPWLSVKVCLSGCSWAVALKAHNWMHFAHRL